LAFPSGLEIAGANRHDMKLVADTLASVPQAIEDKRLEHLASGQAEQAEQGLCMDAGYAYDEVREVVWEFGYTAHIRSRGEEVKAKQAGKRARRWFVERTHSRLNRYSWLNQAWELAQHGGTGTEYPGSPMCIRENGKPGELDNSSSGLAEQEKPNRHTRRLALHYAKHTH
jgi:putative transposase